MELFALILFLTMLAEVITLVFAFRHLKSFLTTNLLQKMLDLYKEIGFEKEDTLLLMEYINKSVNMAKVTLSLSVLLGIIAKIMNYGYMVDILAIILVLISFIKYIIVKKTGSEVYDEYIKMTRVIA